MNIMHVRKCCQFWFLFASHLITYWKLGLWVHGAAFKMVFNIFQNRGGPTILKDAPCAHDTNVFTINFRKSILKLFYKQEIINILKQNQ